MPDELTTEDLANIHSASAIIAGYLPRRNYRAEIWQAVFVAGMVHGARLTVAAGELADEAMAEFDKRFPT